MKNLPVSRVTLIGVAILALVVIGLLIGQSVRPDKTLAPSPGPKAVATGEATFSGTVTCLSPKNTSGAQTLECAIGMSVPGVGDYAIQGLSQDGLVSGDMATGNSIKVKGIVVLPDSSQPYDIVGTITGAQLVP